MPSTDPDASALAMLPEAPPKPSDPALADAASGIVFEPSHALASAPSLAQVPSRCRVLLLPDPRATERGVVYRRGDERYLLAWPRIRMALAAEVGEPEGVCTTIFDLALDGAGSECVICRIDADPGDGAKELARAIELGLGRDRCSASLKNLAHEGVSTRHYEDLDTLTEAHLEAIRFRS